MEYISRLLWISDGPLVKISDVDIQKQTPYDVPDWLNITYNKYRSKRKNCKESRLNICIRNPNGSILTSYLRDCEIIPPIVYVKQYGVDYIITSGSKGSIMIIDITNKKKSIISIGETMNNTCGFCPIKIIPIKGQDDQLSLDIIGNFDNGPNMWCTMDNVNLFDIKSYAGKIDLHSIDDIL